MPTEYHSTNFAQLELYILIPLNNHSFECYIYIPATSILCPGNFTFDYFSGETSNRENLGHYKIKGFVFNKWPLNLRNKL